MSIDNLESPIANFTANPFRRKYDDQLTNPLFLLICLKLSNKILFHGIGILIMTLI